jgi:hypothetical protein
MKRIIAATALTVAFAAISLLGIVPEVRAGECSNATLQGSFGYTSTGTLLETYVPPPLAGPFAEVGRQTFDGKGETDGTATLSANGNTFKVHIQGANSTYKVNSDCTGSMSLYVVEFATTVNADFVIDDDGAEIRAIVTDANLIESRVYKKQFREGHDDGSKLALGTRELLPRIPASAPVWLSSILQLPPWRGCISFPQKSDASITREPIAVAGLCLCGQTLTDGHAT